MRKAALFIMLAFLCTGFLFSGTQSVTGYYSDPSGYGFHHIESGYLMISVSVTIFTCMLMFIVLKRIDRMLF